MRLPRAVVGSTIASLSPKPGKRTARSYAKNAKSVFMIGVLLLLVAGRMQPVGAVSTTTHGINTDYNPTLAADALVAAQASSQFKNIYSAIIGLGVQPGGAPLFCGPIFTTSSTILNLTSSKEPSTVTSNPRDCYYLPTFIYPTSSATAIPPQRQATFYINSSSMQVSLVMDTAYIQFHYYSCSDCWSGYENDYTANEVVSYDDIPSMGYSGSHFSGDINSTYCCARATWVGMGTSYGASGGDFSQTGYTVLLDSLATDEGYNFEFWYQFWNGNSTPEYSGLYNADSCTVASDDIENILQETSSKYYETEVENLSSSGCSLTSPSAYQMGYNYAWAYAETEAPVLCLYAGCTYYQTAQWPYFSSLNQASSDNIQPFLYDSSNNQHDFNSVGTVHSADEAESLCTSGGVPILNSYPSSWYGNGTFNQQYATSFYYPTC